jgi:hypothetical protein
LHAAAAIDSQNEGKIFSYQKTATEFGIDKETLHRQHQGLQTTSAGAAQNRQKLRPQQEKELVRYIQGLTDNRLPPTHKMVPNFAEEIAKEPCSDQWVDRFLHCNNTTLTSQWTTSIDCSRACTDTEDRYCQYFELLPAKIRKYNVDVHHIYYMDEKEFLIGVISKSKRTFSKQSFQKRKITAALQDGNQSLITILACICADGTEIDPTIIYTQFSTINQDWQIDWID